MRFGKLSLTLVVAVLLAVSLPARADNGSYTYSGGSFSVGANIAVSGAPMSAAGATLSFSCPVTSYAGGIYQLNWTCAGGSVTIATADKSVLFNGKFIAGSMTFSGSGGGKGGHVTYYYQFSGDFNGSVTSAGVAQSASGSLSQSVKTTAQIGAGSAPVTGGTFGWNSAYSPVLVGDNGNGRIVAADNITGANLASFGKPGNGTGEFTTIAGITQDKSGRIYVTDSALNRIVRVDNATGKNWVEFGSTGTGANHFNTPLGVAIDSAGKIWVADSGNNRIVRMDDMSGTNWTSFGTLGTGIHQFSAPSAIAFDAQGRTYVADTGNGRLVRFDDLTGKNWVSLAEVLIDPYGYPFSSIDAVSVNSLGQIFVATGGTYGYLIRCSDMTGANPSVSIWSGSITSMSLDKAATIYVSGGFTPGLAQVVDPTGTGYFASNLGGAVSSPSPVYASASNSPTPADGVLSPKALTFTPQNVGESSASQQVTLWNLGATALTIDSISASHDFKLTKNCGSVLAGGATCTISVAFDPTVTGARSAELLVTSNGVHPSLGVVLTGTGIAPKAVVLPGTLTYDAQLTQSSSAAQIVTLTNTGTGPLTIASIKTSGDFTETSNCGAKVQPGNGCTLAVVFKPTATGARTGALTISDDAIPTGTTQVVALSGTGVAVAPTLTVSPEAIHFPDQKAGTVSASQTVTLKNSSLASIALGTPEFPAGFKVTTSCGASLAKGTSCAFKVAFAPAAAGPVSGVIKIPVTGQAALTMGLSGTGTNAGAAVLVANPAAVNFGQVVYNDSQTLTFTVTNPSGLPVAIASHGLSGAAAITLDSYNCPAILAGGASCTVGILFTSTSTTPFIDSATYTFTEGSGAKTQVPITGEAVSDGGGGM